MMKPTLRTTALYFFSIFVFSTTFGQVIDPVHWEFSAEKTSKDEAILKFTAQIDESWYIYAQDPNGGLNPTSFVFEPSESYERIGEVEEPSDFERKVDDVLGLEYNLYSHEVVFTQKIKITSTSDFEVKGMVTYFSCDDQKCLPPKDEEFSVAVEGTGSGKADRTLIHLMILSFLGGLAALLTPCVYPIIPLTVSFFMRSAGTNRKKSIITGIMFSLSIILIYTSLGLIMGLFQIDLTGAVASHWLANSLFFIVFLVFAFSFFGMFELVLPSKWSNNIDAKADKGGFMGTFFMALATVLISFSCTGPIVGVLIGKSLQGEIIQPVMGMFAFALAFSLPFPLLAMFPNMVKNMPKSGGWLNSVKVFFAFVMLAFSLKFLHNIDKVLHWGVISRELFIAAWIVLFILLGLYFLGKIKFSHDSDMPHVGVPRFMLALASFIFAVYLLNGMLGAELRGLSAILPAKDPNSTSLVPMASATGALPGAQSANAPGTTEGPCGPARFGDFLELPHGLQGYYDLEEGLACAREVNKPVFLDFKGHVCSNCKEMEQKVWSDPRVLERLRENYVIIGLYTDDRSKLPEDEWYTSQVDGKEKKTLGKQNLDYQIEKFGTNSIPYYVLVDHQGNKLAEPRGHDLDIDAFIAFLDKGVENFNKQKQPVNILKLGS
jgi:thiol:disulfide interchange protein